LITTHSTHTYNTHPLQKKKIFAAQLFFAGFVTRASGADRNNGQTKHTMARGSGNKYYLFENMLSFLKTYYLFLKREERVENL